MKTGTIIFYIILALLVVVSIVFSMNKTSVDVKQIPPPQIQGPTTPPPGYVAPR